MQCIALVQRYCGLVLYHDCWMPLLSLVWNTVTRTPGRTPAQNRWMDPWTLLLQQRALEKNPGITRNQTSNYCSNQVKPSTTTTQITKNSTEIKQLASSFLSPQNSTGWQLKMWARMYIQEEPKKGYHEYIFLVAIWGKKYFSLRTATECSCLTEAVRKPYNWNSSNYIFCLVTKSN